MWKQGGPARPQVVLDRHGSECDGQIGVLRMPDDSVMLFNTVCGKPLSSGSLRVSGVLRFLPSDTKIVCPIVFIGACVREACTLGVLLLFDESRAALCSGLDLRVSASPYGDTPLLATHMVSGLRYWLARHALVAALTTARRSAMCGLAGHF
jgi:hypothetical protein